MAVKAKSRREKMGSGLGLLLGILIFNQEIWDTHLFDSGVVLFLT